MPISLHDQKPNEWLTGLTDAKSQHDISVAMCLCMPDTSCVASLLSMVALYRRHGAVTRVPSTVIPLSL